MKYTIVVISLFALILSAAPLYVATMMEKSEVVISYVDYCPDGKVDLSSIPLSYRSSNE